MLFSGLRAGSKIGGGMGALKIFGVGATLVAPLLVGGAILGTTILAELLDLSRRVGHLEAKIEVVLERLPPVGGRLSPAALLSDSYCPLEVEA